jgi:TolB-like protein/tetratricopeptide (TPR) repeat protein
MGEVYRARDPRLKRDIAIKVLPETTAADPERRARLEREAQSIAALSHPNIVTIYSVEDIDGVLCLTMEYVDGKPLSEVIGKGGLPLPQLLKVALPLADAISAAHEKGIAHRDLKPANVMVGADGRVKVLDFGLAKLMEAPSLEMGQTGLPTATLTAEGRIMGTVAYMSPEQAEGKPLDHRSDIFSLGVLLFELATGVRPFKGDTALSTITSILRDVPRPVTEFNHALPRELARIVRHCLVKDPEYRYQSAKDLRNDLHELKQDSESGELGSHEPRATAWMPVRLATQRRTMFFVAIGVLVLLTIGAVVGRPWSTRGATGSPIDSIAVLPFVNVGADPSAEYLSDGITENLINSLSQLSTLRVIPRSTVFRYKGREVDFQKVGRDLSVRAVLTGRVVQRGDTLNIQTELIDVTGDAEVWGRQYTRTLGDLVTVQEEIATAVTDKLRLRPTSDEQKRLTKRYTGNSEAQQLYLKGQYYWNRRTARTLLQAAESFQQAIDRDSGYALAWAGLADCYALYGFYGVGSPREFGPRAKQAALTALRIDETLDEAHATLGWVKIEEWDWLGARSEFLRAIELNPRSGTAHQRYAAYFLVEGRVDEATAANRRALELEPLSLIINTLLAREFYHAHEYDRAVEQARKSLELDPNFAQAHLYLGWTYEQQARYEDAIAELRRASELSDGESEIAGALGHAYAVSGKQSEAKKALAALKERLTHQYVAPFDIAVIYAGLGDKTPTFEWLDKAYEDHSHWLVWIKVDPRFDLIRDDPRYQDLLRRMKIPE